MCGRSQRGYHPGMTYVLHYAPDNASLIIRLALEHGDIPYRTCLVDRAARAQDSAGFRALNPNGLIPVLETPDGPLFETGAILLWLADRHGGLGPAPKDPGRGAFLKWLFYLSNTPHALLRQIFYADRYIGRDHADTLYRGLTPHVAQSFATLDAQAADRHSLLGVTEANVLQFYLCALLRWSALYPRDMDRGWFDLSRYPALDALCHRIEALPCVAALCQAEGMSPAPFSAPTPATPPEGSAT